MPVDCIPRLQASVKSEVGKLIKRLCVLLCMNEEEHANYSLYVEGSSFTYLTEVSGGDLMAWCMQRIDCCPLYRWEMKMEG